MGCADKFSRFTVCREKLFLLVIVMVNNDSGFIDCMQYSYVVYVIFKISSTVTSYVIFPFPHYQFVRHQNGVLVLVRKG